MKEKEYDEIIEKLSDGLINGFLIDYSRRLNENSYERKDERMFLKQGESYRMIKAINELFDRRIKHQKIKKYGEYSKIRTGIREEPKELAQYLMGEKGKYNPVGGVSYAHRSRLVSRTFQKGNRAT